MLSIHLTAAAFVIVSWLIVMALLVRTAPVAYQNRNGFHVGEGHDED